MRNSSWLTLSSFTAVSRVLGLIRDVICAQVFGASAEFDAFIVAFQIPNFMRRLFAEGAMAQAFVPLYAGLNPKQQKTFAGMALTMISCCTFAVVVLAWFAGKGLICLYAPGFAKAGQLSKAINMLHWTMPYITAISIVTICSGINNSHNKFALTGAITIVLNLILILAALISHQNIIYLAYGVFFSGIIQVIIMLICTSNLIGPCRLDFNNSELRRLVNLMGLGALAAVVGQLGVMLDTFLASWLSVGSVSAIYFAQRLVFLPIGIVAVAVATALTPTLAKLKLDHDKFKAKLSWGGKLVWQVSWPACFGLIVMAPLVVKLVFEHGAFDSNASILTSNIIMAMSLGLPAFMLNKVLLSALYAQKQAKRAVNIMLKCLIFNFLLGLVLMYSCKQIGIVLATVLSAWLQFFLLAKDLQMNFLRFLEPCSSVFMALVLLCLTKIIKGVSLPVHIAILLVTGIIIYELCLRLNKQSLVKSL